MHHPDTQESAYLLFLLYSKKAKLGYDNSTDTLESERFVEFYVVMTTEQIQQLESINKEIV